MKKFPQSLHEHLKHYVYAYVDSAERKIFYVGMGQKDRLFNLDRSPGQPRVHAKIKELFEKGYDPEIHLLRWGLDQRTAEIVESTVIDALGIQNLTNTIRSTEAKQYGRMHTRTVLATLSPNENEIVAPAIMLWPDISFNYSFTEQELYDITRQNWQVGEMRNKVKLAFSVIDDMIWEVYQVEKWVQRENLNWDFVGRVADEAVRNKYLNIDVRKYYKGYKKSFRYFNVKRGYAPA